MSLDTVVKDIREEARARADDIRDEAEEEAQSIIAEAESEAEEIVEQREREVERTIEQEREQRLSSAKLEAKQERLEARRNILESVRGSIESELAALEANREELTRKLLADAAEEFDSDAAVDVYGRADDAELIESILEDEAYDGFTDAGEYDCLGGVVVESDSSRVRVNNTFDSVFEDVWDDNLREVSERLFEAKNEHDG
ncbi:V-type ATP synthase subunit E [Halocatena pleomorpha]|uniref:A-type ATP synthase subunit E n=1 Tax=Halocatena pleomorpha TaxID=1785090 RepID=A0A3P3RDH0_9EURY|nr:V-type ATP synthase subunit E [Halocatena pleomorpha]RRJ30770.1 V-type ATP synthase subunit E [Halocatena pleomorpha]